MMSLTSSPGVFIRRTCASLQACTSNVKEVSSLISIPTAWYVYAFGVEICSRAIIMNSMEVVQVKHAGSVGNN